MTNGVIELLFTQFNNMLIDKYAVIKEMIKPENKYKKFIEIVSFAISITGIEADIIITGIDISIENFAASTLFNPTILEPV